MKRGLIVLNGNPPGKRLLRSLSQQTDIIIAADGGANTLMSYNIPFHVAVGDFDSADMNQLQALDNVTLHHDANQDDTDFEKSLRWIFDNTAIKDIIITGGIGDVIDHSLSNISVAAKYAGRAKIRQVEDNYQLYYIRDRLDLTVKVGETISLIAVGVAEGVKTEGLKWPLKGERLALGYRDGVRNVAIKSKVHVDLRDGCAILIRAKTKGEVFRW